MYSFIEGLYIMYGILEKIYQSGKLDVDAAAELTMLLASLTPSSSGQPSDLAMMDDWIEIARRNQGNSACAGELLSLSQLKQSMLMFLRLYIEEYGFAELGVLLNPSHVDLTPSDILDLEWTSFERGSRSMD